MSLDRAGLEVARTLLAGWLAGAVVGLGDTALLLVILARHPGWAARLPALRVRLPILGVLAANGMVIGWTLVGLLLGALALRLPMPAFALVVAGLWLAAGGAYTVVRGLPPREGPRRDEAALVWGTIILATLVFAILLPWLANRR